MTKVLMAGPVPDRHAGISKLAGLLLHARGPSSSRVTYISTSAKGHFFYRLFLAGFGTLQFSYQLIAAKPDVVHLHVSNGLSIIRKRLLQSIAALAGVPVILHLHGFLSAVDRRNQSPRPFFHESAPRWMQNVFVGMLEGAEGIIALSPRYAKSIRTITENPHIFVLFNPVACHDFGFEVQRSENSIVLFMGDFSARKGARDLLETVRSVSDRMPSVQYVFCGHDEDHAFEALVRKEGLSKHVTLPGFVSREARIRWLQRAAIFVLPSYQEGVPMAILEAMAAGLPIVATRVGGIPDILENNANALMIEPGDTFRLARGIAHLLGDTRLRRSMGARNRRKAKREYDLPIYMERLSRIYADVLARRGTD